MTTATTEDQRTLFYHLLPELLAEDARAVAVSNSGSKAPP